MGPSSDWMLSLAKGSLHVLKSAIPFAGAGTTLIVSLCLFTLSITQPTHLSSVRTLVLDTSLSFERTLKELFEFVPTLHRDFLDMRRAAATHRQLEDENTRLKGWQEQARILARENTLLRQQLNLSALTTLPHLTARVIGQQRGEAHNRLLLAAGYDQGVAEEIPVVSGRILVGHIAKCGNSSAMVVTTKDPSVRIPVVGEHSGKRSVVTGTGGTHLSLVHAQDTKTFTPGEFLLTTTEGAFYPPDYIVGRVVAQKDGTHALMCALEEPMPPYVSILKHAETSHG